MVPRYRYNMEVTVCSADARRYPALTSDVSLHGMGLTMARDAVFALAQGGALLTPGDRFDIVLSRHVASVDGVIGPTLNGRVRHVRRLSQNEYHVGVWFDELDQPQQAALQAVVDQAQPHRSR